MIDKIQTYIERWRDEWDLLMWRSSAENREMVKERLKEHDQAMKTGGKSPYFDYD